MELLFGAMCRNLEVLPGESFVDEARRWTQALCFIKSLKPRDVAEWLQAIDVTTQQFSAINSLLMLKRKGLTRKQRSRHDREFLVRATAMQDARRRYDQLRQARVG